MKWNIFWPSACLLLEKEVATHSGILAWRIPWSEEPDGLQSLQSKRIGLDWVTNTHTMSSLEKCLIWVFSFLIALFVFDIELYELPHILEINPISVASFANIFNHSVGLFILLMVSFAVQKLLCLIRFLCLFLLYFLLPWKTDLRKYCYNYVQECFAYVFFCEFYGVMSYIYVYKSFWVYFLCMVWTSGLISLAYI